MDPQQRSYETVPIADEADESLSNTEVDESLMGDDKHWDVRRENNSRSRKSRAGRIISTVRSYRWLIDTALLLVIIVLLLVLRSEQHSKYPSPCSTQVGGDFTGKDREFTTRVTKWEANEAFVPMDTTEFFSNKTLATWNTVMPAGAGYAMQGQTFSTTSMTHQLHCLFMMGRIYAGVTHDMKQKLPEDYHHHFLHCIDYLRQGIMCSADLALEVHGPSDSNDLGPLDGGWNGYHVCKDYSQVLGYLDEQITEKKRIVLPIDD